MKVYHTKDIRNVALVGGARSGKTTLAEAMLFEGGVIKRRGTIEDKNTVSDYREIEIERQNSVFSTVMYAEHDGKKINIIDTPGFDDFVGEVISALRVCDTALLVVNAQNGVEVGTEITWRYTTRYEKPVVFVLNQLEHEKANFEESLQSLITQFGNKVIPVQFPVATGMQFQAIVDVMKMKLLRYDKEGGKAKYEDIPGDLMSKAEEYRNAIIEAAAESDDALMEKYFEQGTLSEQEIADGLRESIKQRKIYPVFCVSAKHNTGVDRLLDFIVSTLPSPDQMKPERTKDGKEILCDPDGPFVAFVFKTSIEQHLGEVSFFKVCSGTAVEAMDVVNSTNSNKERLNQLYVTAGKQREKVEKLMAGDIGSSVKLKSVGTNDTLVTSKTPDIEIEPIVYPDPKYRMAVRGASTGDEEKISALLNEMHKVDPTLIFYYSKELKQMILEGQGEMHLNVAKWQIETLYKIPVEYIPPKIPYRETITKPARASYRHKKQSGGAGQFGEVHMHIQPYGDKFAAPSEFSIRGTEEYDLPWGGKLQFNNCIVGGAIDSRFMPAILKGIMEKMEDGPLTGSYARDIAVYVYDGKMHPVDSNEISFKLAGRNAFKEAFKNAGPKILEPIYEVEILVPSDRMGDVITDLQGRRGVVLGMESEGNYQKIKAKVPLAEMNRYSTALSSLTSGKATYTMKFSEYQQVPPDIQAALLKAHEEQEKEED